jgi:hypothetical protein
MLDNCLTVQWVVREVSFMTHIARDEPGPFEVSLLAFIFIGSLASLVSDGPPGVVDRLLGEKLVIVWSGLLLIGPVVAYIGIFWRGRANTARAIEQAGLVQVAGAALIYAIVLLSQHNPTDGAFKVSAFVAGFGIASIWRIFQIFRVQREDVRRTRILNGEVQ